MLIMPLTPSNSPDRPSASSSSSSPGRSPPHNLNPLKVDESLRTLLDRLLTVQSARTFTRWQKQFLQVFESYLDKDGIADAETANAKFTKETVQLAHIVHEVQSNIERGSISQTNVTVRGRNSINELNRIMSNTILDLHGIVPSTRAEEKERGYDKFQMGAVLVRDGFTIYARLTMICDLAKILRQGVLVHVADKQILEMMDYFDSSFRKFCDLMADLGLYDFMLKAQQFANKDQDDQDDMIIFIDLKTGGIGEMYRKDCFDKGMLTLTTNKQGEKVILEAAVDETERAELTELIKSTLLI